jgi:glycosyltransferase involved in cell wall biosynthesis
LTPEVAPEVVVAGLLEERNRLLRALRTVTHQLISVKQDGERRRANDERVLARLEATVESIAERERHVKSSNPVEVAFPRRIIAFADGCLRLGAELAADVYLSHDDLPLLAAKMLRDAHGGRIVYDAIEIPDYKSRSRRALVPEVSPLEAFLRAYDLGILHEPDTIMTVGRALESHLRGMGFHSVAIENYRYYNEHRPSNAIRLACGVADDDVLALQLNNVYPTFGFETILEYWARLPSRFKLATLGTIYPDHYKASLREKASELGLEARLTLLDPVPYDELADYAGGADFMFMKRTREIPNNDMAMPNRVFDALAARLPICCSELRQIKAFIEEQGIGTTFDPDSFDSFAAAVHDVADNAAEYRARVELAAQRCVWEAHDERIESIFGAGGRVVILGMRDVCNNRRCHRIADTLLRLGGQVVVVGPEPPESPNPAVVYHVVDIEGQL